MRAFRILVIIACCLNLWGCGSNVQEQGVKETQVLARINGYKMTIKELPRI